MHKERLLMYRVRVETALWSYLFRPTKHYVPPRRRAPSPTAEMIWSRTWFLTNLECSELSREPKPVQSTFVLHNQNHLTHRNYGNRHLRTHLSSQAWSYSCPRISRLEVGSKFSQPTRLLWIDNPQGLPMKLIQILKPQKNSYEKAGRKAICVFRQD